MAKYFRVVKRLTGTVEAKAGDVLEMNGRDGAADLLPVGMLETLIRRRLVREVPAPEDDTPPEAEAPAAPKRARKRADEAPAAETPAGEGEPRQED